MTSKLVERIQARMTELNTNATQVSVAAGLGKTAVRDILAGKSQRPTMHSIGRIATVLKCTVAYLIGDVGDPDATRADEGIPEVYMKSVRDRVEVGTFKKLPSEPKYAPVAIYGHPLFTEHDFEPYVVGDRSLSAIGILPGDILTAARPYGNRRIELHPGTIVICVRTLTTHGITEISARVVEVEGNATRLTTQPLTGDPDVLTIAHQPKESPANFYMTTSDESVTIEGEVIRASRDIG